MEAPWFILSHRYGGDTSEPTAEELRVALDEVYEETIPSMTLADCDWIRSKRSAAISNFEVRNEAPLSQFDA